MKFFSQSICKTVWLGLILTSLIACHGEKNSGQNEYDSGSYFDSKKFNEYLISQTAKEALDCGWIKIGENRAQADQCVINAFNLLQPFYMRYDVPGIDSQVAYSMLYNTKNELFSISYDSYGYGHIFKTLCREPMQADLPVVKYNEMPIKCKSSNHADDYYALAKEFAADYSLGNVLCKFNYNILGCFSSKSICNIDNIYHIAGSIAQVYDTVKSCQEECLKSPQCLSPIN